jgi:hypothetical protein
MSMTTMVHKKGFENATRRVTVKDTNIIVTLALESYLPEHMSSPSVFSLGSLSSILSFLVVVCQPLFVLFLLIIVLSVIFITHIILLKNGP